PTRFAFAPDSRLAFNVLTATSESYTFVESVAGGPAGGVLPFLVAADLSLLWSPHGVWLAIDGMVSAGRPTDANPMFLDSGLREGIVWSPDDLEIAYTTISLSSLPEAVVGRPDFLFGRVRVSPPLGFARGVTGLQWSPDSALLLYLVDAAGFDVYELYASARDGS